MDTNKSKEYKTGPIELIVNCHDNPIYRLSASTIYIDRQKQARQWPQDNNQYQIQMIRSYSWFS